MNAEKDTIPEYSLKKTLVKGGTPLAVVILVKIVVEVAKSYGFVIDDATALAVAMSGYGAVVGFINWLKNRKRKG